MSLSDGEIITRVQRGERELFGELHARHHERVFRFVAHSIYQREAAQDVAGEVWLKAYRAVDSFAPRDEHSSLVWLLRIAANAITDYRRSLRPCVALDEDDDNGTLQLCASGNQIGPENEMMRREKIRAVRAAIEQLSESDRQIIFLAHQRDLSSAQIAQILEKPSISSVTSQLHRAMSHLKTALQRSPWFAENDETESDAATSPLSNGASHSGPTQRVARCA